MTWSTASPIPLGATLDSTAGAHLSAELGRTFCLRSTDGNWNDYILLQAGASALPTAGAVIVTAFDTNSRPNFVCSTSTIAEDPRVVAVIPAEYTTAPAAYSYFLGQVSGTPALVTTDTTLARLTGTEYRVVTATLASTGSGAVRAITAYTTASAAMLAMAGVFGLASSSTVATAAGQTVRVTLTNLYKKFK